jgi:hypothetical protein
VHEENTISGSGDLHHKTYLKDKQEGLTFLKGCEEHLKPAVSAALIRPHADHPQACAQHDVIGHGAAELGLQVLHRTAPVIHSHEIPFAFIRILHLIVQET